MLINTVRIRNFPTIADDFTFRIDNKRALIGPNNVGKSNILQAIHLFFSLHHGTITNRGRTYSKQVDFPSFSAQSGKTTILMIFQ